MNFQKTLAIIAIFPLLLNKINCDYFYPPSQTPDLPEIIINRDNFPGYFYPQPIIPFPPPPPVTTLPPLAEEPPNYLPPPPANPVPPPSNDYLPPNNDLQPPANDYLPPPVNSGKSNAVFNSFDSGNRAQMRILEMSCFDANDSRFFKATVQWGRFLAAAPTLDKRGCVTGAGDTYSVNLEGPSVADCGVKYCADKKMCLNLRLPILPGIQLPEDTVVRLQCQPQSKTASLVKQFVVRPQVLQAKNLGTVAAGGTQRKFEPSVAIFRRSHVNKHSQVPFDSVYDFSEFNQHVEPGSSVFLGEDLIIKATVRESDGWKFSKIGAVTMQQGLPFGKTRKSIALVDQRGCRIDSMKVVCPEHPKRISPLINIVPFRAFLFQDDDFSNEMVLSVRLVACMQQEDCRLAEAKYCSSDEEKVIRTNTDNHLQHHQNFRARARRSASASRLPRNGSSERMMQKEIWESHLDFQVVAFNFTTNVPLKSFRSFGVKTTEQMYDTYFIYYCFFVMLTVALLGLLFTVCFYCYCSRVDYKSKLSFEDCLDKKVII